MQYIDMETGKQYVVDSDQTVLNSYIVHSIAQCKKLGYEQTKYAFLYMTEGYFKGKRTLHDLGALAFGLFSSLNEPSVVNKWEDKEFVDLLLHTADDAGYFQAKIDEGEIEYQKPRDHFVSELQEYFKKNEKYLEITKK